MVASGSPLTLWKSRKASVSFGQHSVSLCSLKPPVAFASGVKQSIVQGTGFSRPSVRKKHVLPPFASLLPMMVKPTQPALDLHLATHDAGSPVTDGSFVFASLLPQQKALSCPS